MMLTAAIGTSLAPDARQAGMEAAQLAIEQLGKERLAFGWVIASAVYSTQEVVSGILDILGEVPMIGFSTSAELNSEGRSRPSVVVGLFSGEGISARAGWWQDFSQDSRATIQTMLRTLQPNAEAAESLLLVADGLNGDANLLCELLDGEGVAVAGCLAGGDIARGRTYQVGGRQTGSGGLAGLALGGDLVIGVGAAHGWQPIGALTRLTRVQGQWVRTLDDQPASETYARWFGYPAREWSFPPLSDLVRLYPLGIQESPEASLVVRSPLRIEADGSLRMNSRLPEGKTVDLMVGSLDGCEQAVRQAAGQALRMLDSRHPCAALLLIDVAWQALLELHPQSEIQILRSMLGDEIPIFGGYTLGQFGRLSTLGSVEFMNQHIEVVLFAPKNL